MRIICLAALVAISGCTTTSYTHGNVEFSRTNFMTDSEIEGLRVEMKADGTRILEIDGVNAVQSRAIEAAARGAAQGAAPGR